MNGGGAWQRWSCLIVALVFVTIMIWYILMVVFFGEDSLSSQVEFSVAQALYARHQDEARTSRIRLVFDELDGHKAVSILAHDSKSRAWVLLNPYYGAPVKVVASSGYSLSSQEFATLSRVPGVTPAVLAEFAEHTVPAPPPK